MAEIEVVPVDPPGSGTSRLNHRRREPLAWAVSRDWQAKTRGFGVARAARLGTHDPFRDREVPGVHATHAGRWMAAVGRGSVPMRDVTPGGREAGAPGRRMRVVPHGVFEPEAGAFADMPRRRPPVLRGEGGAR